MEMDGRGRVLVAGLLTLLLSACTATSDTSSTTAPTSGPVALQAAPRDCPRGFDRASRVPLEQTEAAMGGYLPTWFPQTDFGLVSAWSLTGGPVDQSYATWTDQRCRTVTVYYNEEGGGPTDWKVGYDKAKACGNSVMGMGECIGLRVALPMTGGLSVQTIGLSRADAEHLVESIPL